MLGFGIQSSVLDRDGGVGSERRQQAELLAREAVAAPCHEDEDADKFPADDQGHVDRRDPALSPHPLPVDDAGLRTQVVDDEWLLGDRDVASHPLAERQCGLPTAARRASGAGLGSQHQAVTLGDPDSGGRLRHDLRGGLGNPVQDLGQLETLGDGLSQPRHLLERPAPRSRRRANTQRCVRFLSVVVRATRATGRKPRRTLSNRATRRRALRNLSVLHASSRQGFRPMHRRLPG
jgi:hypothetical protein